MVVELRVREYLEYIAIARNLSPLTVASTKHVLGKFCGLFGMYEADKICFYDIENWMIEQSTLPSAKGTPKKPSTINTERALLRSFFRYCRNSGDDLRFDPANIVNMKTKRLSRSVLRPEDVIYVARQIPYDKLRLCVLVMFYTGLRVGEVIKLRPSHLSGNVLAIEDTKSEEPRPAFLPPALADELRAYIDKNNITKRIFPYGTQIKSLNYERYHTYGLRSQITKHFAKHGYKVSPHDLRHAFASMLHRNGADIFTIKEFLGHSDVRTTQIYVHMDNHELAAKHAQFANIRY